MGDWLRGFGTRRLPRLVGVIAVLAGCAPPPATPATPATVAPSSIAVSSTGNPFRIGRPLVIAHGGGDGLFPEDTLYAYEHSMAIGGDVVDADVQLTADNVPIAFHDDTLDGATNGTGPVADKTYAELAGLDAGWSFTRDSTHPYRGKGTRSRRSTRSSNGFPTRSPPWTSRTYARPQSHRSARCCAL